MEVPSLTLLAKVRRRHRLGAHREHAREHASAYPVRVDITSRRPAHDRLRRVARPRAPAHDAQDDELWRDAL